MNKKLKKLSIWVAVGLLGIVGAGAAFAGHAHHDPARKLAWAEGALTRHLDLDESQKQKLGKLKERALAAYQNHHADRSSRRELVERLVVDERLDRATVESLIQDHRTRFDQELPPILDALEEFHASLSAEQKQEAVALIRKFQRR
ncbi:MAG: hypothetical protein RJA70_459 [Pseudomonadota bacterium]|jgi:Spy/CpxP family protein refolding chaperone